MNQRDQATRAAAHVRELEQDGMQISTQSLDRDLMQVSGALIVGVPEVAAIVAKMRTADQVIMEVLAQVRDGAYDIKEISVTQELEKTDPQTLSAFLQLQDNKPALLKSLADLASRADWQKLLDSVAH